MIRLNQRRGFTLVEMLVAMGIIVLLTAAAMLIVPSALDKNRSTDAVTSLRGWLEIAQARAARDGAPRGLRLIVDDTKPAAEQLWITEVQYIESPPVMVFNPNPPYPNGFVNASGGQVPAGTPGATPSPLTPRVEFEYALNAGTVNNRVCRIRGLTQDQANQIVSAASGGRRPAIWLPVLGTWHRILAAPNGAVNDTAFPGSQVVEVMLDQYPDTELGAATSYVTYHFGIYGPPRPLLGEVAMQMPINTCIDLNQNVSYPPGSAPDDYDILFAPSGPLAFTSSIGGEGHVFLCVRDQRKGSPMDLFDPVRSRDGGEMMILALKARSGAIAVQPVDYGPDPYLFAKQAVSGQ